MKLLLNRVGGIPIPENKYLQMMISFCNTWINSYKKKVLPVKASSLSNKGKHSFKIDLKMKLSAILLIFGAFVLQANSAYSQKKISINLTNATVERLLDEIESKTDFRFIYSTDDVDVNRKVSVVVKGKPVDAILKEVFVGTKTAFSVDDGQIFLLPNKSPVSPSKDVVQQDPIRVTGNVIDENGLPLAGATVQIKGTNTGTAADFDGNYTIIVPNGQNILVFTNIGYTEQEIAVGNQTTINVTMEESVSQLDEVIVNSGYYRVPKKLATTNTAKVSTEEIEKQPVSNPLQTIQGRMPGVFVQQTTGLPGGAFNIQIRGQNSLRNLTGNNGNLPLYIVDGVPFTSSRLGSINSNLIVNGGNPLNSIHPNNIESIEILKDADATSIYGSRGANGVVLITTKRGKEGKTIIEANISTGLGEVSNRLNLLNSSQYLEMRNEAFANDGVVPDLNNAPDLVLWDTSRETDWQDLLIGGTAVQTNTSLSISGGNSTTQFLIQGGYFRETTVLPGDLANEKYSSNFNLNHKSMNNRFNINFSGFYSIDRNNLQRLDPTLVALTLAPVAPEIFDEEGNLNWKNGTWDNPFSQQLRKFNSRTSNLIANAVLNYQIWKGLNLKANLGYNEIRYDETVLSPSDSFDPTRNAQAISNFSNNNINTWIVEPQLEYNTTIGKGQLAVLVGGTLQENRSDSQSISATGFSSDALLNNIRAASDVIVNSKNIAQYNYNALFGRINYNWANKYIVNLTGRRDGSSRFGPGRQFANFGAVGAAWIFSHEKFITEDSFLSFGKLRASYGTTGSDQIGDYGFLELWNPSGIRYDGRIGLSPTNLFNSDFAWEENEKFEVGLDLSFLNDNIAFRSSYYRNESSNQLVGIPLPFTTGFSSIQANLPAIVQNKGFEFELNTININKNEFKWTSALNLTIPRTKLVSYPNIEESAFNLTYAVGEPLDITFLYRHTGVDPETGIETFEDVSGDDLITIDDFQPIADLSQDFFGGLSNIFSYKGLELDLFVQFVKQKGLEYYPNTISGGLSNQPSRVLDRWQEAGDNAEYQRFSQGFGLEFTAYRSAVNSNKRVGDASFVRLKNVSIAYQLPLAIVNQLDMQSLRVFIQGQNLITITNYFGLDPETQIIGVPPLRAINVGLQLTF